MKIRRMAYSENRPDGTKASKKSAKWYAVFVDFRGALRRLPLFEDRRASEALAKIVDRINSTRSSNDTLPPDLARAVDEMPAAMLARLAKWDIIKAERAATAKPLADHIEDWRKALLARGNTPAYADLSANRAKRVLGGIGTVSEISPSKVQTFLAALREDRKDDAGKVRRGIGAASFNYYLRDCRAFFRWMLRDGRAFENPLAHLQGVNARSDKRHERRALANDELRRLLDVTEHGWTEIVDGRAVNHPPAERYGMTGPARATLYRLAVETGLRSNEIRSLTRASFRLGDDPTVTINAAYAKNRRQDELPLRPETAALLESYLAGKMPAAAAFAMPSGDKVIHMFRADLAEARTAWIAGAQTPRGRTEREGDIFLAYRDDAGRYVDFHALRHTFISNLAAGGVHPKTAQRLARHSTITLTMDRYTHLRREDLAGALTTLPDLSSDRQTARATGTDGGENSLSPSLSPNGEIRRNSAHSGAMKSVKMENAGFAENSGEKYDFPGDYEGFGSRGGTADATDLKSVAG